MYIVKQGMLQLVADDGSKILATLSEGAVFGELSIMNIQGRVVSRSNSARYLRK